MTSTNRFEIRKLTANIGAEVIGADRSSTWTPTR